jgi:hypothetical protein
MSVAAYDLGIHLQDVWPYLRSRGAVKIVGYQRSGKSTLAEVLQYELLQIHATVVHNDATKWLHGRTDRSEEPSPQAATVDPELAEAISGLEQEQDACWVVDDAEVLLAYATDNLLRNIGQKIMSGRFSMILIRNRFVHEHAGWFNDRESLLHADLPTLQLRPLPQPAALQAARASYHGPSADSQAAWLVTMSGGIPGLMSDLAPFAPAWANAERTGQLLAYAMRRRQELRLERPLRSALIRALKQRVLPPWAMLSPKAAVELRTLEISGMVNPRYAQRSEPFCGEFWHLVAGRVDPVRVPDEVMAGAFELETVIGELGLGSQLAMAVGLDNADEGDLADAFARCLSCQRDIPELVRSLSSILADNLGKAQIANALHRLTGTADTSSSCHDLAVRLLTTVGLS